MERRSARNNDNPSEEGEKSTESNDKNSGSENGSTNLLKKSLSTDSAVKQFWEVPSISHFCSLFREVFKLLDFDIEDLEEALIIDCSPGARSELIVDLLVALLKGLIGRRDISVLNYNQFLFDLFEIRWERPGLGVNPLGEIREKASFHILPLCAKVKLLNYMCEWRLERPDVEALTRNLTGESLRVNPLGQDDQGNLYWYFYGTRLYCENPEPVKLKITNLKKPAKKTKESNQKTTPKKGKKRKRGGTDSWGRKTRKSSRISVKSNDSNVTSDQESDTSDTETLQTPPKLEKQEQKNEPIIAPAVAALRSRRCSTKAEVVERSGRSSPVSEDEDVEGDQKENDNFNDLVQRIYSREDDDNSSITSRNSPQLMDEDSNSNFPSTDSSKLDTESKEAKTEDDSKEEIKTKEQNESKSEDQEESENNEEDNRNGKPTVLLVPKGPPAWEQPLLLADSAVLCRWHTVCCGMEDWISLTKKFEISPSKQEKDLHRILKDEFLSSIEQLVAQKEKEMQRKLAELAPRRASDRLEVKRLIKDQEQKVLQVREDVERARLDGIDNARRRKYEMETREQRLRLRELEKEKQSKLKERSRDERAKRLEIRKKRQEYSRAGVVIPPELESSNFEEDDELEQLEDEIEQETMYGQLEKVLDSIRSNPDSTPFLHAVTEEIAPDYFVIIENPMDLDKMENKLLDREYITKMSFIKDMNLLLLNCLKYNGIDSDYTRLAQKVERVFIRSWRKYFAPTDVMDDDRQRKEQLECIKLLGALDKKIRQELEGSTSDDDDSEEEEERMAQTRNVWTPNLETRRTEINPPINRNAIVHSRPIETTSPSHVLYDARPQRPTPILRPARQQSSGMSVLHSASGPVAASTPKPIYPSSSHSNYYTSPHQNAKKFSSPSTHSYVSTLTPRQQNPSQPQSRSVPPKEKPNVYLLPATGGNRLIRFVTKDGKPASPDLVQQVLPQIKNEVNKFPPGKMVTVTLTVEGPAEAHSPETPPEPPKPTPVNLQDKFYHLGGNSYLKIIDGQPYLFRKDLLAGTYQRVKPIEKEGLMEKLRLLQQSKVKNKGAYDSQLLMQVLGKDEKPTTSRPVTQSSTVVAQKPICSVAPQRQLKPSPPKQLVPSPVQRQQSQQLVVQSQPVQVLSSNQPSQSVMMSGGTQFILPPGTRLVSSSSSPSSQPIQSSSGVQVIQLQMPSIVLNNPNNSPQKIILQQSPSRSTSSNAGQQLYVIDQQSQSTSTGQQFMMIDQQSTPDTSGGQQMLVFEQQNSTEETTGETQEMQSGEKTE